MVNDSAIALMIEDQRKRGDLLRVAESLHGPYVREASLAGDMARQPWD